MRTHMPVYLGKDKGHMGEGGLIEEKGTYLQD